MDISKLTKQQLMLILQMLQQITFPEAEAKIVAGNLQLLIEANLADQES